MILGFCRLKTGDSAYGLNIKKVLHCDCKSTLVCPWDFYFSGFRVEKCENHLITISPRTYRPKGNEEGITVELIVETIGEPGPTKSRASFLNRTAVARNGRLESEEEVIGGLLLKFLELHFFELIARQKNSKDFVQVRFGGFLKKVGYEIRDCFIEFQEVAV